MSDADHVPVPVELPGELASELARAAAEFGSQEDVTAIALAACRAAQRLVPGAEEASLSLLLRQGRIATVAATDDRCFAIDAYQEETGDGPCAEAAREDPVTHLQDTDTDPEWPEFSRWARARGVGSMMAIQLSLLELEEDEKVQADPSTRGVGALNLYASVPRAFSAEAEEIAQLLGVHITLALRGRQRVTQLREALASRDLIGRAKGILIARLGIDDEAAFELLRQRSRDTNTRLVELARSVVESAAGDDARVEDAVPR